MQNLAEQASCKMGDEQGANCFFNFLSGFKMGDVQGDNCFFNFLSGFPIGRGGGSFGGLLLDKVLYREDPPRGPTPYPLYTIFDRKSTPVVHFLLTNSTHFTLYMLGFFNINKYF